MGFILILNITKMRKFKLCLLTIQGIKFIAILAESLLVIFINNSWGNKFKSLKIA